MFRLLDADAQEWLIFILSGTFEARPGAKVRVCDEQTDPRPVDEYHADPGDSSIRYPSDVSLGKPAVDVLVVGSALASGPRSGVVPVELRVGDIHKRLVVSGNRRWLASGLPSDPDPFETMPIIYERASGGRDPHRAANPVGIGPQSNDSRGLGTEVANVQYPEDYGNPTAQASRPAGFGAIAPWWSPRVELSGTYDETWLSDQAPLLPRDFDLRFFQRAPHDQQSQSLRGGEAVRVDGMTANSRWELSLPRLGASLRLLFNRRAQPADLALDTVLLEPNQYRVTITERFVMKVRRGEAPLREVVIGPMRRGPWRARLTGKIYIDEPEK